MSISQRYNTNIPIGSMLCQNHLKSERKLLFQADSVDEINIPTANNDNNKDDYEPEELDVSEGVLDSSTECAREITGVLDASPFKFKLKRKVGVFKMTQSSV